ncbi:pyridoxal-phosphate dependent enzyme [bacterium]|nr:pyridoxal-phosphate dependent enzyme [bacterium]
MKGSFFLQCSECDTSWELDSNHSVCPVCSPLRQRGEPLRGVLELQLDHDYIAGLHRPQVINDIRDLLPLLPLTDGDFYSPLALPPSPLYPVSPSWCDSHRLLLKDDTRQPTGSFKDRATLLVVARARERGCDTICAASTGNAGSSLAGLAAASGLHSVLLVPAAAPPAKLIQMLVYGARLVPVAGSYDDAFELSIELEQQTGWINRNTAWNPFTIEGKKTAAVEIAWQLDWQVPDILFVPCGDGVIISGLYKGFSDCLRLGWIERMPRLIAVQAEGSSVIVDALHDDTLRIRPGSSTIADSICVDAPRNLDLALRAIRATNGGGVKVTDLEIMSAVSELAQASGVFAEPAAASVWAGARRWLGENRDIDPCTIVLMITGSGLKAADRIGAQLKLPATVPADLASIMAAVGAG